MKLKGQFNMDNLYVYNNTAPRQINQDRERQILYDFTYMWDIEKFKKPLKQSK